MTNANIFEPIDEFGATNFGLLESKIWRKVLMDKQSVKAAILTESYASISKKKGELEVDFETVIQRKQKSSTRPSEKPQLPREKCPVC